MSLDDQKGVPAPKGEESPAEHPARETSGTEPEAAAGEYTPAVDDTYNYEDPYGYHRRPVLKSITAPEEKALATSTGSAKPPPPATSGPAG